MKFLVIVPTTDANLVAGILDLVTGRVQAQLAGVLNQTTDVLKQAEAINTDPPA